VIELSFSTVPVVHGSVMPVVAVAVMSIIHVAVVPVVGISVVAIMLVPVMSVVGISIMPVVRIPVMPIIGAGNVPVVSVGRLQVLRENGMRYEGRGGYRGSRTADSGRDGTRGNAENTNDQSSVDFHGASLLQRKMWRVLASITSHAYDSQNSRSGLRRLSRLAMPSFSTDAFYPSVFIVTSAHAERPTANFRIRKAAEIPRLSCI
jgi:hypothetical protein